MPLSRAWTASVLCRWLAGANQRITPPLFYSVNFLQSIFLLLSLSTYIIPWLASKVKGLLIFFLPSKKGSRVEVFWLTPWTFRKYGFGTSRKHLITFLTFKFHFHNQFSFEVINSSEKPFSLIYYTYILSKRVQFVKFFLALSAKRLAA